MFFHGFLACVKIGSVPNVKSLLEEKKRLLTMASSEPKKLHKTMVMRQSNVAKAFQQQSQTAVQQSSRFSGKVSCFKSYKTVHSTLKYCVTHRRTLFPDLIHLDYLN